MVIITYIMGHTLTITKETLPTVHKHLENRTKPAQLAFQTSPRLANRQLKFFFHVLRNQSYEEVLRWQQATFHMSGNKDSTWLPTFCVMLVLAMVLEEVQCTIQIQADTEAQKLEVSSDEAQLEARLACERIDSQFSLLTNLFQRKYRDKTWTSECSFGSQTPLLQDPAAHKFCIDLRHLLSQSSESVPLLSLFAGYNDRIHYESRLTQPLEDHLCSRKDMTISSEKQCKYTSRLVASFLMPFLNLPK